MHVKRKKVLLLDGEWHQKSYDGKFAFNNISTFPEICCIRVLNKMYMYIRNTGKKW